MKISDRDKKLIVIIIIAIVIAGPYLLLIKPYNEKQATLETEIVTLQERYNYLCTLNEQRDFYLSEIERFKSEREVVISEYAGGIRQENTIMFLRNIELSFPLQMTTLSFTGNVVTPIDAGVTDENGNVTGVLNGVSTATSIAYTCDYENMKQFLDYILKYKERMVVSALDMTYDDSIGKITGIIVLEQYAFTGDGRELAPAVIPSMEHGNESIFGTYISDEELREKLAEEAEDEETEE